VGPIRSSLEVDGPSAIAVERQRGRLLGRYQDPARRLRRFRAGGIVRRGGSKQGPSQSRVMMGLGSGAGVHVRSRRGRCGVARATGACFPRCELSWRGCGRLLWVAEGDGTRSCARFISQLCVGSGMPGDRVGISWLEREEPETNVRSA